MRVQSLVTGQQGRVDVEHPSLVTGHEVSGQHAHEAGQHHQISLAGIDGSGERRFECRAIRLARDAEVVAIHHGGSDAQRLRARDAGGGNIGDHQRNFRMQLARAAGFGNGQHVAAGAGDQHRKTGAR